MEVIATGTEVTTLIGKVKAVITGICIRGTRVTYELSYFVDGDHKSCWVDNTEIVWEAGMDKVEIGYATDKKIDPMFDLCAFQHWLGSNYATLPTNSIEMTRRAQEYRKQKGKR